jgi:DNA repair protein RecO (recombination protein O)
MNRFVTRAVLLQSVEFGEADRIVTFLSEERGRVSALAKNARRSARRFGAGLSLFGYGEATLAETRGDLYRLERFDSARGFPYLALEVAKVAHASYACELVRELAPPNQAEPELFALLLAFLGRLDQGEAAPVALRILELQALEVVGWRPEFERCIGCGTLAKDEEGQVVDIARGGLVCGPCQGHGRPAPREVRRALVWLQHADLLEMASPPDFSRSVERSCREVLTALVRQHLGRPLRSLEFIHKLNHRFASER